MGLAEIPFPHIDPEIFSLGFLSVRWYGLSYVAGFLVAWFFIVRLCKEGRVPLKPAEVGDLIFATMLGVVIGGRLGYVLVYKPAQFLAAPVDILKVWTGGMSFHGGCLGVAVAVLLFGRRRKIPYRSLWDACAIGVTPGLFFGRLANFVNGELWGRPTDVPWAMVFPDPEAGIVARHPSQIYEALLEGLFLFLILWTLRNRAVFAAPGRLAGTFLVGYGLVRFLVEFTREPDAHLGRLLGPLSMGQILSTLMIIAGIWMFRTAPVVRKSRSDPVPLGTSAP